MPSSLLRSFPLARWASDAAASAKRFGLEILKEADGSFDDGLHTQSISNSSVVKKMAYLLTTDEDDILTPVYA